MFGIGYTGRATLLLAVANAITRDRPLPTLFSGVTFVAPIQSLSMSTTSLKIPSEVTQLAIAVAQKQGISPHAFMVDAIRVVATAVDKRAQLVSAALAAREETLNSGQGFAAADVKTYLLQRAQGEAPARPVEKSWRT
jgi:hypothetical protein